MSCAVDNTKIENEDCTDCNDSSKISSKRIEIDEEMITDECNNRNESSENNRNKHSSNGKMNKNTTIDTDIKNKNNIKKESGKKNRSNVLYYAAIVLDVEKITNFVKIMLDADYFDFSETNNVDKINDEDLRYLIQSIKNKSKVFVLEREDRKEEEQLQANSASASNPPAATTITTAIAAHHHPHSHIFLLSLHIFRDVTWIFIHCRVTADREGIARNVAVIVNIFEVWVHGLHVCGRQHWLVILILLLRLVAVSL